MTYVDCSSRSAKPFACMTTRDEVGRRATGRARRAAPRGSAAPRAAARGAARRGARSAAQLLAQRRELGPVGVELRLHLGPAALDDRDVAVELRHEPAEPATSPASPCSRARARSARERRSFSLCAPDSAGTTSVSATATRAGDGGDRELAGTRSWAGGGREGGEASSASVRFRAPACSRARDTVRVPSLPHGEPAPARRRASRRRARGAAARRPLGVYVHVPFCASRCGYCDFNTYVPGRRRRAAPRTSRAALAEIRLARRVLGPAAPPVETVFFGGGTPTLLAPPAARRAARRDRRPVRPRGRRRGDDVEANPETSTPRDARARCAPPASRASRSGCRARAPHVLAALERRHTPGRAVAAAARGARGGLRARQPRPHLRHAGRDRRRLGGVAGRGARRPGSTTSAPTA